MKFKRLTEEKSNGQAVLKKKDIDFDMLSPVIAKVLIEAIDHLAELERKIANEKYMEVPYPIKSKMNFQIDNRKIQVIIAGYEISDKDMIIILETNEGIMIRIPYKDAFTRISKIGSVDVT